MLVRKAMEMVANEEQYKVYKNNDVEKKQINDAKGKTWNTIKD